MNGDYDFLVLGSGLAGLTFALQVAEHGKVCVLTKAELFESNTSYAQGGIAAAVGESDSWELHEEDTLIAGAGLCDREAVRMLVKSAPDAIQWLADIGVRFDKGSRYENLTDLALGREGGHSRNRIVHHADKTGWEVERAMNAAVRANPNIAIRENSFVTQLLLQNGRCVGASAMCPDVGLRQFYAKATLVATGGCGRLYQYTTNPRIATADGVALGSIAGAAISDMEFIQFHPTTLYHPQSMNSLITEAVRGEGATLRNHHGERFMYRYDERLELAPRDIVARAIDSEMRRLETWCVYLDATHFPKEMFAEHFPTISEALAQLGIEPHRHWIPIVPAQHYVCGGINTDLHGRTSISSLYASGEVARTGVHGANRLASNSLLEALVFSKSAAEQAIGEPELSRSHHQTPTERPCVVEADAVRIRKTLRRMMFEHVGIVRHWEGLRHAEEVVQELSEEYRRLANAPFSQYAMETENLLITAQHVVRNALARKENVGLHFNADIR